MNDMKIFSIGKIENNEKKVCINLDEKYAKGLRGLDCYSHVQVLWWADGCDNESKRNILVEEKPYKNGPDKIGVFALHSPERPNPIAVSNVNIAYVDIEHGVVGLYYIDAFDGTNVIDLKETDEWYEYFDDFASLLDHPKSLVRNRALYILAANAQWDEDNHFDAILDDYLAHVTDEKPITARQCVKALAQVGVAKPQYIPMILSALHGADLSKYKDSMRPLIEKDMSETERVLTDFLHITPCDLRRMHLEWKNALQPMPK